MPEIYQYIVLVIFLLIPTYFIHKNKDFNFSLEDSVNNFTTATFQKKTNLSLCLLY